MNEYKKIITIYIVFFVVERAIGENGLDAKLAPGSISLGTGLKIF